jgi:hypothetical protein
VGQVKTLKKTEKIKQRIINLDEFYADVQTGTQGTTESDKESEENSSSDSDSDSSSGISK